MRHDKLRQWHDDTVGENGSDVEEKVIPHQSIADKVEPSPALQQPNEAVSKADDDTDDITDGFPDEYDRMSEEQKQFVDEQQDEYSEVEQKAMSMGWVPKERWHGNPDDWTSAKRFVQTGEMIQANRQLHSKIDYMENEFNKRLQNQQKLHEAQLKMTIKKLEEEKYSAAELGDREKYNEIDQEIRTLKQEEAQEIQAQPEYHPQPYPQHQPAQPTQQPTNGVDQDVLFRNLMNHPTVQSWREKNPWIEQQSPRSAYAEREFVQYVQKNMNNPNATVEEALAHVDDVVRRQFNNEAPQHSRASMSEKRGGPTRRQSPRLTMSDLTREEKLIWQTMGKTWKNQDSFLQAVKDNREAERNNNG